MIRIIVVEDSEVVRSGIIRLLNYEQDMEVVASAGDGFEAIELLSNGASADVILVDLNMPKMDGVLLTEHIVNAFPEIRVIIFTMHAKSMFVDKSLKAGARGYLLKDGDFADIMEGIRKVFQGEIYVNKNVQRFTKGETGFSVFNKIV
ncbi:MAG: response regulator transcription factor [Flavobacterium sp.]|nr:MAG: response regulator transcription factor [Flavobacterium sp.]